MMASLIRFWPRTVITCPTDTDTFFHFYLVDLIRKSNHKVPEYLDRFTLKAKLRKPYLFYWACSFVPQKYDPLLERLVTTICDCLTIFVIYLLGLYVSSNIFDTPWTPVSLYATALLAVSPGLLRLGSGPRAFQGTARVFSQALYVIHITLFYLSVQESSLLLLFLSACFGSLVIMSGSFAIQVFFFFGILISLVHYNYLIVIFISLILLIIFTKGSIFDIFKGRIFHLSFYAKKMQRIKLWGNPKFDKSFKQFINGWRQAFRQYKAGKGYQVLMNQFLSEQYFAFILIFSFTPLVLALFLPLTDLPFDNIKLIFFISLFSIIVGIIIKIKYFLFLGEGERYLEYGLPFASVVTAVLLYHTSLDWVMVIILAYSVFLIPFFYSIFFSKYNSIQNDYPNIQKMFHFLNEQPDGNVLSIVSAWMPLYLSNKPIARSVGFDPELSSKRDFFTIMVIKVHSYHIA